MDGRRKMLRHSLVIIVTVSFCCFFYGIYNINLEVEDNACRMTYMFGQPQFSRVQFVQNKNFPNYGLYYYYEGASQRDVHSVRLNGAPVIFVPGNGGSYKQVRSLASVALKKAKDNDHDHQLDYFTIDFHEELSGLYGGYLENQRRFLKICIQIVLGLYADSKNSVRRQVVLIGHSMGGKIAQSVVIEEDNLAKRINTVISISSPLDSPVVKFDRELNDFYLKTNNYLSTRRTQHIPNLETNACGSVQQTHYDKRVKPRNSSYLENMLFISIGGGNRDLLVNTGLTTSRFSDIHAMTSAIPKVWLSCDHLSSVWCLQVVLVITRFLYTISYRDDNYVFFIGDKIQVQHIASSFFLKYRSRPKVLEEEFIKKIDVGNWWHEESKRVFKKQLKQGLKQTYNQMVPLPNNCEKFKKLHIMASNVNDNNWLYGCRATTVAAGKNVCERGTSLSHYIHVVPFSAQSSASVALVDTYNIRKTYKDWTHILLRFTPSRDSVVFNVDLHDPTERQLDIKAPRWFNFQRKIAVNETMQGTTYYKLFIQDIEEPFQTLMVIIKPIVCTAKPHQVTTRICVPWAAGFDRYQVLNDKENILYISAPIPRPVGYNTSKYPISLDVYLDPNCRYRISYQFSVAATMSKVVHEYYHWLPSHLTAVLCILMKNEITKTPNDSSFKFRPYAGFFQTTSLFLITGCRLMKKLLMTFKFLPMVDISTQSFYVSTIVHSAAIGLSIMLALCVWIGLTLQGNVLHKLAFKIAPITFVTSSVMMTIITTLPITFGVLGLSIAFGTCSGVALMIACVFYFTMISNSYKDYMENWLWQLTVQLSKKIYDSGRALLNQMLYTDRTVVRTTDTRYEHPGDSDAGMSARSGREQGSLLHKETNASVDMETECRDNAASGGGNDSDGLENFSFHITLFLMLFMTVLLNFGVTIAWVKNYRHERIPSDPSLVPCAVILICLSVLLQLKAPTEMFGHRVVACVLYVCASICIIYCQEAVYRLNYVIAFVFTVLVGQEVLCRIWRYIYTG